MITIVTASTTFHRDQTGGNFGGRQANSTFAHRNDWTRYCTLCEAA